VNGWKLSVPRSGFARGERVVIAVRPELVFLASAEHEGNIEWTGVVREHVLLGDCIRTEIGSRTAPGWSLRCLTEPFRLSKMSENESKSILPQKV
jgi:hypothetical protein